MKTLKTHLWAHVPGALIPSVEVEADDDLHAAALGLRDFVRQGFDITPELAHIDISDSPDEPDAGRRTVLISEVLDWLQSPEQRPFAEEENLQFLL